MKKVRSADGTSIAFETVGQGPPLLFIAGAFCDHTARAAGRPLAELLAGRFTGYVYDRRGRGESGDTAPYAVEREIEDVAAILEAAGRPAYVYGHSSGAVLALAAAIAGLPIRRLVVYEAPVVFEGARPAPPTASALAELAAAGKRSEAAELFLTKGVMVPPPVVAQMKGSPDWAWLESLAHTLSYDLSICEAGPAFIARAGSVRVPVLAGAGGASAPWMRGVAETIAGALPSGQTRTLEGQRHDVPPAIMAPVLESFFVDP